MLDMNILLEIMVEVLELAFRRPPRRPYPSLSTQVVISMPAAASAPFPMSASSGLQAVPTRRAQTVAREPSRLYRPARFGRVVFFATRHACGSPRTLDVTVEAVWKRVSEAAHVWGSQSRETWGVSAPLPRLGSSSSLARRVQPMGGGRKPGAACSAR